MTGLTEDEERAIAEEARRAVEGNDPAHGWDHVVSVVRLARVFGRELGADERVLVAAAYLHDVVSREEARGEPHELASARRAGEILRRLGLEDLAERVPGVIVEASYGAHLRGEEPTTPEAAALRDADLLEAMGARGIARAFAFAGYYRSPGGLGFLDWDPEDPPELETSDEGPDPSAIHHFAAKLLRLLPLLRSETARKMGEGRLRFMVSFLRRYRGEMEAAL